MRTFTRRRADRIERIERRIEFLSERLRQYPGDTPTAAHVRKERSALQWALEDIERMNKIEAALAEHADAADIIMAIEAICESRRRPTEEDMERTPALARQYGAQEPR